jgi:hypothetical protein
VITIDREATAAKRFEDDRSKVLKDGREICYGEDWEQRKSELWERCGGRCEAWREIIGIKPERCTAEAEDPHHLVKRSICRDDRLSALQALCRFHHDLLDERKPKWSKKEAIA